MKKWFLLSCVACVWGSYTFAAIAIDGYSSPAPENNRFANDPSFILNGKDLSGVSIADNGRWVTMISANVFLSAQHYYPINGTSVSFYAGNDPLLSPVTRSIAYSEQIANSDLRIGYLNQALPGSIGSLAYATQNTTNNNTNPNGPNAANAESFINSPYYLENAYLFGRSPESYTVSQDMAVGRNVIDRMRTFSDSPNPDIHTFATDYDVGAVTYEAQLVGGDSGAPMLVDDGFGGLTLVGINWYVYDPDWAIGDGNGVSYVGNYSDQIDGFLAVHSIPELSSLALLSILIGVFGVGYRWT
jgi:hypothetical protein